MKRKPPGQRPAMLRALKALLHGNATVHDMPLEAQPVLALLAYAGRFRGWSVRVEELREARENRAQAQARTGYFQCCCGVILDRLTRQPVEPAEPDPEILTLGILQCAACKDTPWDVFAHYIDGETAGETRRRLGYHPSARREGGGDPPSDEELQAIQALVGTRGELP